MDKSMIDHIAASLEYGKVTSKKRLVFLTLCLIFAILSIVAFAALGLLFDTLFFIGFLLPGILLPVLSYQISRGRKSRKVVMPFIEDAVELAAVSKKSDAYSRLNFADGVRKVTKLCKLQLRFEYKKKKTIKTSGVPGAYEPTVYTLKNGYARIFNRYADRTVRILYSPKYDQVVLLKDSAPEYIPTFEEALESLAETE